MSEPADVMLNQGEAENTIKAILSENTTTLAPPVEVSVEYIGCNVSFEQQMMGFLYVLFLVTMVLVLAFKAKGVRENYREAMYIGKVKLYFTILHARWRCLIKNNLFRTLLISRLWPQMASVN